MHGKAMKYLATECIGSATVNGLLNLGAASLLFRGRDHIPVGGSTGLLRDTIGETFLATCLSYLVATLISRQRRRTGALPQNGGSGAIATGNIYLRSLVVGLLFTAIMVPLNAWILPRVYPSGLTLREVISFKALFGACLGGIASYLAISRAFREGPLQAEAV